jgi:serine/threonine-protein kinase
MPDQFDRINKALADHYRIERVLGSGGMATVYLAEDVKHHRQVAIKVLRPELAASIGADRFLREIEIAAQLNHPNILTLIDSGEADGLLYYVMTYVEGESLRERLEREKQLPIDEALQITSEVADALGYAHSLGIVHRDIKPENILFEAGHAVVADFGIAKAVTDAGGARLTETGLAIGTPAYMSPEQAVGTKDVDTRSDVYSLGCVLYEMLGGDPPFLASTPQLIIARKSAEPAPSLKVVRRRITDSVEYAVSTALETTPADRFATVSQFVEALHAPEPPADARQKAERRRWWTRPVSLASAAGVIAALAIGGWWTLRPETGPWLDPNVVAVLPFRVTAPNDSLDFLREGIPDYSWARLTGDGLLRAVDVSTVLAAKRHVVSDESLDLSTEESLELASRLGAGWLLTGQVIGAPGGTTIRARLLSVSRERPDVEHSVSGAEHPFVVWERVLGYLVSSVAGEDEARLGTMTDSLTAVLAYQQGEQAFRRGRYHEAVDCYNRALEIDSTFALAALAQAGAASFTVPPRRSEYRRAWELRDRLSARDRAQLATLFWVGPNYPAPYTFRDYIAAHERAVAAAPDRAASWEGLGTWLMLYGQYATVPNSFERAQAAFDSAFALDSSTTSAWGSRLWLALFRQDPTDIREVAPTYFAVDSAGDERNLLKWWVATALRDTATLDSLREHIHEFVEGDIRAMPGYWLSQGFALDDALLLAFDAQPSCDHAGTCGTGIRQRCDRGGAAPRRNR